METHGDFKTVELQISRWNKSTNNAGNKGRWVTKSYLKDHEKYSQLLDCKRLVRKNPVHGEDEARLVLEDFFSNNTERGEMTHVQAQGDVED